MKEINIKIGILLILATILLSACGGNSEEPAGVPEAAAEELASEQEESDSASEEDQAAEVGSDEASNEGDEGAGGEAPTGVLPPIPAGGEQVSVDCSAFNLGTLNQIIEGNFNAPMALGEEIDCAFQSDNEYFLLVMVGKGMSAEEIETHFGFGLNDQENGMQLSLVKAPSGGTVTGFGQSGNGYVLAFSAAGRPGSMDAETLSTVLENLVREAAGQVNAILMQ